MFFSAELGESCIVLEFMILKNLLSDINAGHDIKISKYSL